MFCHSGAENYKLSQSNTLKILIMPQYFLLFIVIQLTDGVACVHNILWPVQFKVSFPKDLSLKGSLQDMGSRQTGSNPSGFQCLHS